MNSRGRYITRQWVTVTGRLGDWRDEARCRDAPQEVFELFWDPSKGNDNYRYALAYCQECPVAMECLDANINEPYGVVGGTTPDDRQRLRRRRKAKTAA